MCHYFEVGILNFLAMVPDWKFHSRHPDDLYKNGIQRSSFVPCIELLKSRFDVTDLDSGTGSPLCFFFVLPAYSLFTDYRRIPRTLSHVYYDPLSPESRAEVQKIFTALTSDPSDPVQHHRKLETWGRAIVVPESTSTVAKFRFDDLCGQPLSAADYIKITETFGTIFVLDVPKMGLGEKDKVTIYCHVHNAAGRLLTLSYRLGDS